MKTYQFYGIPLILILIMKYLIIIIKKTFSNMVIFSRLRRRGARGLEWPERTVPEGVVVEQGVGLEGHSIVSNVFD